MESNNDDNKLSEINRHLGRLDRYLTSGWRAFIRGVYQGAGGVAGAAIIIFIIGIILNVVGVIPEFKEYADNFKIILEDIRSR